MHKKLCLFFVLCLFLPILAGCSVGTAGKLTVDILKIGKADAIILRTQNHCVLVDAGEEDDGEEILSHLRTLGVTRLDCLILTHLDKDHIGSAAQILEGCSAAVCYNDETALLAIHACQGAEVAWVSFDQSAYARMPGALFRSLGNPKEEVGRLAAEKLLNMLATS